MRRREAEPGRRGPKRRRAAALQGVVCTPRSDLYRVFMVIASSVLKCSQAQELLTGEKAFCRFEKSIGLLDEGKVARFWYQHQACVRH